MMISLVTACLLVAASPITIASVTLSGVTLGDSVTKAVALLGPPQLVQTTDAGHEWRWYNAGGLDVDVLTDDDLAVREILTARPEPVAGHISPLVQPKEFPLLEQPAGHADKAMVRVGSSLPEPEQDKQRVWQVGRDIVVLELSDGTVRKLLALDRSSAEHLGYIRSQPQPPHRAPRLVRQVAVDYPKRAIENHAQGVVVVLVAVSSSGSVSDVKVIVSSGNSDIDDAEMLSMRKSTFAPARCNGQTCDGVFFDREEYSLGN